MGPVDVTLPYNPDKVSSGDGSLVYAIPTKDGWEIRPVNSQDNTATIYTDALGDPLIAWHFVNPSPDENVCGSSINVKVIPVGDKFNVVGRIVPQASFFSISAKDMSGLTINIQLNGQGGDLPRRDFSVTTSKDGTFTLTLDPKEVPEIFGSERGWNWLFTRVECHISNKLMETVEGFAPFQYFPPTTEQPATPTIEPAAVDTPLAQPSPPISTPRTLTDNIPVPKVVGMSFEDAMKTLEDLGFSTVWIDGTSKLELGKIYSQAPKASALAVPHRTTVVIYRTTEVDTTPPECAQFNLAPEECANSGMNTYSFSGKTTAQAVLNACGMGPDVAQEWGGYNTEITITVTSDSLTLDPSHGNSNLIAVIVFVQNNDSSGSSSIQFAKKALNHYEYDDSSQYTTYTIDFNSKGFEIRSRFEHQFTDGLGVCEKTETFTLAKP